MMAGEGHAAERACRIAGVSHAGYYMWRLRAPSERSMRHAWLLDQIIEVHAALPCRAAVAASLATPITALLRGPRLAVQVIRPPDLDLGL